MPVRRPCLDCPKLAEPGQARCTACTRHRRQALGSATARGYDSRWAKHAKAAIADHRAKHGDICPGYRRPAHTIHPDQWVCDHDLGPLCRSCNATKAATEDRTRARQDSPSRRRPNGT